MSVNPDMSDPETPTMSSPPIEMPTFSEDYEYTLALEGAEKALLQLAITKIITDHVASKKAPMSTSPDHANASQRMPNYLATAGTSTVADAEIDDWMTEERLKYFSGIMWDKSVAGKLNAGAPERFYNDPMEVDTPVLTTKAGPENRLQSSKTWIVEEWENYIECTKLLIDMFRRSRPDDQVDDASNAEGSFLDSDTRPLSLVDPMIMQTYQREQDDNKLENGPEENEENEELNISVEHGRTDFRSMSNRVTHPDSEDEETAEQEEARNRTREDEPTSETTAAEDRVDWAAEMKDLIDNLKAEFIDDGEEIQEQIRSRFLELQESEQDRGEQLAMILDNMRDQIEHMSRDTGDAKEAFEDSIRQMFVLAKEDRDQALETIQEALGI